jgi:hypothetical protein
MTDNKLTDKPKFTLGNRYFYHSKDLCYEVSVKAIKQGYQVKYGITCLGKYFFEIVDPFREDNDI